MINKYVYMDEENAGSVDGGGAGGDNGSVVETPAAEAPTIESGTVLNGGADGEGGSVAPEDKFFGKYNDKDAAEQGYTELQALQTKTKESLNAANDKLKGFAGAPEGGEYTMPEGSSEFSGAAVEAFQEWGAENGLSQDGFSEMLLKVQGMEQAKLEEFKAEQVKLLGVNAQERISNINDKWAATYGADATQWMQSKAMSAQDVEMFESILSQGSPSTVNPSGTAAMGEVKITNEQLSTAMFAKDGSGNMKMQTDPEYKATVDKLTEKYNAQRGI